MLSRGGREGWWRAARGEGGGQGVLDYGGAYECIVTSDTCTCLVPIEAFLKPLPITQSTMLPVGFDAHSISCYLGVRVANPRTTVPTTTIHQPPCRTTAPAIPAQKLYCAERHGPSLQPSADAILRRTTGPPGTKCLSSYGPCNPVAKNYYCPPKRGPAAMCTPPTPCTRP